MNTENNDYDITELQISQKKINNAVKNIMSGQLAMANRVSSIKKLPKQKTYTQIPNFDSYEDSGMGMGHWNKEELYSREDIQYYLNNYSYRSDDFSNESITNNILFSGCSFTFGVGIPQEFTWSKIVSDHFCYENVINLGIPGIGHRAIIFDVIEKIEKFGNPEAVVILFPNPDRFTNALFYEDDIDHEFVDISNSIRWSDPKIAEMLTKVLNVTASIKDFIESVKMLEYYMAAKQIPFFWSTWSYSLDQALSKYNKKITFLNNYTSMFFSDEAIEAKAAEQKSKNQDHMFWLIAREGHPGIKDNEYFANVFIKTMTDKFVGKAQR